MIKGYRFSRLALSVALVVGAANVARADDPGAKGSYATRSQTYSVACKDGSTASIDIRLPAAASFARPVVVICHGWLAPASLYSGIAEHLASRGFAAVLISQPNFWSSSTQSWADHMRDAISAMETLNKDNKSAIFGELDMTKVGVMGHSRGGSAATMLAGQDARIKAAVGLAPVNQYTYYEVVATAAKIKAPYLAINGDSDSLCPSLYPAGFYGAAKFSEVRQYIAVAGAGHMQYLGGGTNAYLTARYYTAWLERFLMGKADPSGWTTGAMAKTQKQQGILSLAQFAELNPGATPAPTPNPTPAPAPAPAPTPSGALLQKGSTGQGVTDVQTKLKALGFYTAAVDGDFGDLTHNAVVAFQTSKGLSADGVVGPKTKAALGL